MVTQVPAIQDCDKFQRVGIYGALSVTAWGNPERGEFALFELGQGPDVYREFINAAVSRGWRVLGCVGIIDGRPETALEEPLTNDAIAALSEAYVRFVSDRLNRALASLPAEEWLRRLHALPDTRPN